MAKGAIRTVKETIVREAVPAAKAAVTVARRHGSRMFNDWTKEYGKERRRAAKSLDKPAGSPDQKSL